MARLSALKFFQRNSQESKSSNSSKYISVGNKSGIIDSLKSKEVQRKLLVTFGLIVLYRILAAVPLPGLDVSIFARAFGNNPLTNFFTIITGGRLDNPSVVAIGLGAYINASIIIQLLTTAIPKLEEISKEGERGRARLNQYTRILAVPLTVVQAFVIFTVLKNVASSIPDFENLFTDITTVEIATMIAALTAGSMLLMWIGELITEYGIGNGISVIIMVSILSVIPSLLARDFSFLSEDLKLLVGGNIKVLINDNMIFLYVFIIGMLLLIASIVYINEAIRKIPIQYARRVRGGATQSSFLPLKFNQAGVMPVIFASALLTFPQIFSQLLLNAVSEGNIFYRIASKINSSYLVTGLSGNSLGEVTNERMYYLATYFVLIIVFSYFYTFVTFKPSETAENLQKSSGFIPGLRPGKMTQQYITKVMIRLTLVGSLFLAIVALIPSVISLTDQGSRLTIFSGLGGTSILIIVGVILDTIRQMKSMTVTMSYDQYR